MITLEGKFSLGKNINQYRHSCLYHPFLGCPPIIPIPHTVSPKGPAPIANPPNTSNNYPNSYVAHSLPQRIPTKQRFKNKHRPAAPSHKNGALTNKALTSSVKVNDTRTETSSATSSMKTIPATSQNPDSPRLNAPLHIACTLPVSGAAAPTTTVSGHITTDTTGNRNPPSPTLNLLLGDFQKGEIPLHSASLSFSPFLDKGVHPKTRQKRKHTDEDVGEDATSINTSAKLQRR